MDDILRIGRDHLAVHGAAALSLRAVARDLGVVSSAVYRYVKNRDELLTLLVVDGYNELGDTVDAALHRASGKSHAEQFRAIGRAVRTWALEEPARYALLFGSPVPGYTAPAEQTTGPGTRVVVALIELYQRAADAGELREQPSRKLSKTLAADCDRIRRQFGLTISDDVIARAVMAWSSLFGAVNFEVFGQYGADTFTHPSELFEHDLAILVDVVGLA